jgi:hypothetical protein
MLCHFYHCYSIGGMQFLCRQQQHGEFEVEYSTLAIQCDMLKFLIRILKYATFNQIILYEFENFNMAFSLEIY